MPDWTYHPLRGAAAAVLGRRRSQRTALRLMPTRATLRSMTPVLGWTAPGDLGTVAESGRR
ncbi:MULTISPECIES: hypothetical protein [unclassified Streptomyces]|uniref:hypothetical protein n=1 Tax=unclassified Streptomyces TaxID=2593676 RepID=UPI002DDBAF08|nr:hypothetical protein [Streptomyces sp. NBC_00243]WRZ20687.1 hypothetical protein OHT59_20335 [Streptomyces sp. NBC_00243]